MTVPGAPGAGASGGATAAVSVYAYVVAQQAAIDDVEKACLSIVDDVVQEDGCLAYHLLRDTEDKRIFAWFEQWRDDDAFQRHLSSPQAARLGSALDGKLEEPMVIKRYDSLR